MEGPLCSVLAFERTQEILILFVLDGLLGGHNHELEIGEFPKSRGMGRAISVVDCLDHRVRHPRLRYLPATLDGRVAATGAAVFEAKFMLPWAFSEEAAAEKYMAQLQHNMWVCACRSTR
jgi:hypothetical protein